MLWNLSNVKEVLLAAVESVPSAQVFYVESDGTPLRYIRRAGRRSYREVKLVGPLDPDKFPTAGRLRFKRTFFVIT